LLSPRIRQPLLRLEKPLLQPLRQRLPLRQQKALRRQEPQELRRGAVRRQAQPRLQ
jgi:hypothetical protein